MRIVHLSDLHIGKSKNKKRVARIFNWLKNNRNKHRAEVVVITGDIVDDGELWQYQDAGGLIDELRKDFRVLCAPGNHDYGKDGFTEDRKSMNRFKRILTGDIEFPHLERVSDDLAVILLDSMEEEMGTFDPLGAQGSLGPDQIRNLDKMLCDLHEDPLNPKVVVALHHHPFFYNHFLKLRDDVALKDVVGRRVDGRPRVDALLFGHKHVIKRFNDPDNNKEALHNIQVIFAAGSSVEEEEGKMHIPIIDLSTGKIDNEWI